MKIDVENLKAGQAEALIFSYAVLAKTGEDLALLERSTASGTSADK